LTLSIALSLLSLVVPLAVQADGMIMPPPDHWMYESGQRAVLMYDEKTKTETLVVGIQFRGNAQDFAWVIPVPSEPTVSQGSEELFTSLNQLTGQSYSERSYYNGAAAIAEDVNSPVTVVRTQTIDYYSVATLKSTDSQALAQWLNENGYRYPTGSEYILNNYVANKWFFVAVKIDLSGISENSATAELRQGRATPLKLVFPARNPVYPMRISSIIGDNAPVGLILPAPSPSPLENSETLSITDRPTSVDSVDYYRPQSIEVELYVLAKHKQALPGFTTVYGNWVNKKTVKSWAVDSQGDALLQPTANKYFLTKLTRSMGTAQMTEDLFPRQAANDKKISAGTNLDHSFTDALLMLLAISIFTVIVFTVGIFSPFGIAFIVATIIQSRCKARGWRIAAWVVQIGVTAIYALIGLALSFVSLASSSSLLDLPREIVGSVASSPSELNVLWTFTLLLPVGAILTALILVMCWQARRQRASRTTISAPQK